MAPREVTTLTSQMVAEDLDLYRSIFATITEDDFKQLFSRIFKSHIHHFTKKYWKSYRKDPIRWILTYHEDELGQLIFQIAKTKYLLSQKDGRHTTQMSGTTVV